MTRADTPYPKITEEVLQPLQPSIQTQLRIGWRQLYYGHMANQWAAAIDDIHPHLNVMGEHIILQFVKIIWTYFLDLWKLQNTHLHHNAAALNLPDYKQAAETLYAQQNKLSPRAQEFLFQKLLQQVLELPPPRLQQWVICGYQYFTKQLKAEKQQALMSTPDIRTFFGLPAQQPDDLQPP